MKTFAQLAKLPHDKRPKWTCPGCDAQTELWASRCHQCGALAPEGTELVEAPTHPERWVCQNCNIAQKAELRVCANCGNGHRPPGHGA